MRDESFMAGLDVDLGIHDGVVTLKVEAEGVHVDLMVDGKARGQQFWNPLANALAHLAASVASQGSAPRPLTEEEKEALGIDDDEEPPVRQ